MIRQRIQAHRGRQLAGVKPEQRHIKIGGVKLAQFQRQQLVIPPAIQRQLVVGNDVRPALRI